MLDKLSALTDHLGDAETLKATAVITGDIRQPPFHTLARQKKPLIGNSAQRIKACRAVIGLGPMSQLGSIASFWPSADYFRSTPRERTSSEPVGMSQTCHERKSRALTAKHCYVIGPVGSRMML
jgi:hypothetical protein